MLPQGNSILSLLTNAIRLKAELTGTSQYLGPAATIRFVRQVGLPPRPLQLAAEWRHPHAQYLYDAVNIS